jgi:hypothetical protein
MKQIGQILGWVDYFISNLMTFAKNIINFQFTIYMCVCVCVCVFHPFSILSE